MRETGEILIIENWKRMNSEYQGKIPELVSGMHLEWRQGGQFRGVDNLI